MVVVVVMVMVAVMVVLVGLGDKPGKATLVFPHPTFPSTSPALLRPSISVSSY